MGPPFGQTADKRVMGLKCVLCVLLKFEEPVKHKILESGVQGEVEVGVDILEVAISTWWVFKARKLRSV